MKEIEYENVNVKITNEIIDILNKYKLEEHHLREIILNVAFSFEESISTTKIKINNFPKRLGENQFNKLNNFIFK